MRNKRDFLPKLFEFIELTNKIPPGYEFPTVEDIAFSTFDRLGNPPSISMEDQIESYRILLDDLPKELFDYVFKMDIANAWDKYVEIKKRVHLLSSLNYGMKNLASLVTYQQFPDIPRKKGESPTNLNVYLASLAEAPEMLAALDVEIRVNQDGFLYLETSEFYQLIADYKIQANRIRECLICKNVFWATRTDKWTCSKACSNVLRQRKWQSENKEDYNEKRRVNYAYKKSIKNKRSEN